ncbi:hypothetical protein [Arenimonas sp.]|uniref:hypothetical protein n=1 Tax=Arenimonas sp. TaxID=1872635 RepID=UPI0039E259E4
MFVRTAIALVVGASLVGCASTSSYRGGVAYGHGSGPAYYDSVSPYDAYYGYDPYYRGYGYGAYGYGPVYFGFSSIGIETFGGYCSVEYRACLPWWYGTGYDPYWRFGYTYGYGGYWNYYGWGGWGGWGWPHHGHGHDHHHDGDGHDHDDHHDGDGHDHDDHHDGHGNDDDHDGHQAGNEGGSSDGSDIFRPRPPHNPRPEREPRAGFELGEHGIGQALGRDRDPQDVQTESIRPQERPDWRRWQELRGDTGRPRAYPRQSDGAEPRPRVTPRPWEENEAATPRAQWPRESRPNYRPEASPRSGSRSESRSSDSPARGESRGGGRSRSRDRGN